MNIIIGETAAQQLKQNYTILELETFTTTNGPVKTFCVVENIPIMELMNLESYKKLHQQLIDEYYKKNYKFCVDAIEHLTGKFGGELDTFYSTILDRISSENT
jgi:hypothetical protein